MAVLPGRTARDLAARAAENLARNKSAPRYKLPTADATAGMDRWAAGLLLHRVRDEPAAIRQPSESAAIGAPRSRTGRARRRPIAAPTSERAACGASNS